VAFARSSGRSPTSSSALPPACNASRRRSASIVAVQREKGALAPDTPRFAVVRKRNLGQLVIDWPAELGLPAMADEDARRGRQGKRMVRAENHRVAAVEAEGDGALPALALARHLDRSKRGPFDLYLELLARCHAHVA